MMSTQFIQKVTGSGWSVGHSLQSHTSEVKAVRVKLNDGASLVLVDTPGFDDTEKPDRVVLKIVANWFRDL
jgi:predicted GTPase